MIFHSSKIAFITRNPNQDYFYRMLKDGRLILRSNKMFNVSSTISQTGDYEQFPFYTPQISSQNNLLIR